MLQIVQDEFIMLCINLPTIIRVANHFGVHNHHVVDGKCRESMDETKRLIAEEVDYRSDAKIFMILLGASKTFLATCLLDDSGNGIVEFLNDKQLE